MRKFSSFFVSAICLLIVFSLAGFLYLPSRVTLYNRNLYGVSSVTYGSYGSIQTFASYLSPFASIIGIKLTPEEEFTIDSNDAPPLLVQISSLTNAKYGIVAPAKYTYGLYAKIFYPKKVADYLQKKALFGNAIISLFDDGFIDKSTFEQYLLVYEEFYADDYQWYWMYFTTDVKQ